MVLKDLIEKLELTVLTRHQNLSYLDDTVQGGYSGDLLSFVMAHAKENQVWCTIQGHINSVAVASLLGLSAIVLTDGVIPTEEMIHKANEENIPVLSTSKTAFELISLWAKLEV